MTLFVEPPAEGSSQLTVACTSGPVTFKVTEDVSHLRSFWSQLGRELARAEGKEPGQHAYEQYRAHSDGKSLASGQEIPEWDGQREDIRAAWAATEF